ncbi:MAG: pyroglutamyl-peptidase I [Anaerolineales bacterium]|nr:pyroglutamyl-peptidase I [Anaerolineales bacterium]
MILLLTGFEPFGGSNINPSEQVARTLANRPTDGVQLETAILPVDRQAGPASLLEVFERVRPQAVVCLGEAGQRAAVSIERLAINLLDYRIADNVGTQVCDQPILPDGPAAYFTTLPVREIMDAILETGIPAELSLSAGAFLCNQVTYVLLHHLETQRIRIPAGFIHLPRLPEQVARQNDRAPSMSLETMVQAVTIAIGVITRRSQIDPALANRSPNAHPS